MCVCMYVCVCGIAVDAIAASRNAVLCCADDSLALQLPPSTVDAVSAAPFSPVRYDDRRTVRCIVRVISFIVLVFLKSHAAVAAEVTAMPVAMDQEPWTRTTAPSWRSVRQTPRRVVMTRRTTPLMPALFQRIYLRVLRNQKKKKKKKRHQTIQLYRMP